MEGTVAVVVRRIYAQSVKWWIAAAAGALLLAVGAAAGGFFVGRDHAPAPLLKVASSWSGADSTSRVRIAAGAFSDDPRRGFVLYREASRCNDTSAEVLCEGRMLDSPARVFTLDGAGALHLVGGSVAKRAWVFDSSHGSRASLEFDAAPDVGNVPSWYILGPRLDPQHLPALGDSGIAVPVQYGPPRTKAVLLIGVHDLKHDQVEAHLLGYLDGYGIEPPAVPASRLHRLLVGPDHALYRIDPSARRLVRSGTAPTVKPPSGDIPPPCSTWAGSGAGSYVACPGFIDRAAPDGTRSRVFSWTPPKSLPVRWTFLAPSPDGKTLVVERSEYACGVSREAFFLPATGGRLAPVFFESGQSEPLGWLRDGSALVAFQNEECEGSLGNGIYAVRPDGTPQLVVSAYTYDATTWGSLAEEP
jgi:hypothetical protein